MYRRREKELETPPLLQNKLRSFCPRPPLPPFSRSGTVICRIYYTQLTNGGKGAASYVRQRAAARGGELGGGGQGKGGMGKKVFSGNHILDAMGENLGVI